MEYRCLMRLFSLKKINYSYRFYSRNILRRKAVRIINSSDDSGIQQDKINPKLQLCNQNTDLLNSVFTGKKTDMIAPQYEILEKTDSRFAKTLNLIHCRKRRERDEKMFLEGKHLINDAIDAGIEFHALYFCHEKDLEEINYQTLQNVEIFKVAKRTMQLLSKSSPEVMGVFKRPSVGDIKLSSKPVLPVTVLCDNIRDPGNLGSIIKHAASAGCQNVLLMKGCTDPWETKVLKVGCGGHFRVTIINNIDWHNLSNYISNQAKIFIADNSSDIEHWDHTPELINYDAQRTEDDSTESTKKYLEMNEDSRIMQTPESNELDILENINLPCYLYSSVMFPRENIVLYVGGETHGVDARIVKLAHDYGGKKVKIPLENSMDSLNSSFAMVVMLYEIKRQLSKNSS